MYSVGLRSHLATDPKQAWIAVHGSASVHAARVSSMESERFIALNGSEKLNYYVITLKNEPSASKAPVGAILFFIVPSTFMLSNIGTLHSMGFFVYVEMLMIRRERK